MRSSMELAMKAFCLSLAFISTLGAVDYHKTNPEAWKASTLNSAAIALYGEQEFSTIKQSLNMELIVPTAMVQDSTQIPIRIRSDIPAKSVALFIDRQDTVLAAVFYRNDFEKFDLSVNIRMERKGTVFAVIEAMNGVLYYRRAFIDVLCLPCMAKGASN